MAESESSSSEQLKSTITCEVNLDTDEIEIKYKDNTTWSHITIWNCEVVPATFDPKIHNELMHATMRLKSSFGDDFHVVPTSIRAMKRLLIFAIGHDTSDDAFQMATNFVEVKKTILRFIREIDVNVTDISLRCWAGEQNVSSEHYNRNTDESRTKGETIWVSPSKSEGLKSETNWSCSLEQDFFEIDLTSSDRTFTRLEKMFDNIYRCKLKRVLRGSLILECGYESQEDALEMVKDHVKVKATILECLQKMDPRVSAIKVEVEYKESAPDTDTGREPGRRDTPQGSDQHGGASSHPSEMEALRPGATQESELPAISREEETRKSGIPLGPDTRATPTPARRDPKADHHLLDASREGNMAAVKRILAAGRADVNCRGGDGRTPVMWAARRVHRDVVGRTPVMWAAGRGHRDVVEFLVSEGADVSLVDKVGNNILHYACLGGDVETVKFVLSLHVVDINSRGERSQTPVMWAAWKGHRDLVKILVSEGADVSLVNEDGNNILHFACGGGDVETVKYVLSLHVVDINSRGVGSTTPVMAAAWGRHRDVVELLVSEGADVSLVDEDGDNILHFACMRGDVETVKFVLSLNVVDINSRGRGSKTPVMWAARRGHRDVVELLVSEGADVSLMDEDGDNILHFACIRGDVETVKFVLSQNVVDIDARDNAGQTAADVARRGGHKKVVKLL